MLLYVVRLYSFQLNSNCKYRVVIIRMTSKYLTTRKRAQTVNIHNKVLYIYIIRYTNVQVENITGYTLLGQNKRTIGNYCIRVRNVYAMRKSYTECAQLWTLLLPFDYTIRIVATRALFSKYGPTFTVQKICVIALYYLPVSRERV